MSLLIVETMRAELRRVCRKCDLNPPGFRRDLLRALAIIRPGKYA